ncbi:MAG: acetyl-CoA acetyltransferase [Candidatus Marinimicrobia bacterium]|jgi:acetyl-CoA C-acetyltransferase|nr:acetyl-CoA acetyltransferase [Candidatus Neomarinimicrobiota bacterium]|tara:strand:+ start:7 stop:1215 length:1209 start_codon:yes stop_codon:yes gene_type:complete
MTEAFIYDHVRTPRGRGKPDGSLHEVTPVELVTQVLAALRDRNELDTSRVDDIVMGVVHTQGEQGANPARIGAINAGYDLSAPGKQLNRFCASGLEAVNSASAQVMSGMSDLCIGGGLESMSRIPMSTVGGAMAVDPQVAYGSYFVPQGISADLIASKEGFSREDVDSYSVESQARASNARDNGYFDHSIMPVKDQLGETLLDHDECIRTGTTVDDLAKLKPSFVDMGANFGFDSIAIQRYPEVERIEHVHHAGNSSVIVDGAASVLVGTKEVGQELGLKPKAKIVGFASTGSEPTIMLTGPAPSARKVLKRCGMSKDDIDLFELNEAFAAVVLKYMKEMDIAHEQINVNGGAIAMGHPLGATGAMVLGTLIDELERRDLNTGLVNLCIGGGMGTSTIVERV